MSLQARESPNKYSARIKMAGMIFLFARMNPPTQGHAILLNYLEKIAFQRQLGHLVVLTREHDVVRNPIEPNSKLRHLQRLFPSIYFQLDKTIAPNPWDDLSQIYADVTDTLIVLAGRDRQEYYVHGLRNWRAR